MHNVKTGKVEITAIHEVNCAGLHRQLVEDVDIVNLAIGNNNKGWNVPAQVQQVCSLTALLVLRNFALLGIRVQR